LQGFFEITIPFSQQPSVDAGGSQSADAITPLLKNIRKAVQEIKCLIICLALNTPLASQLKTGGKSSVGGEQIKCQIRVALLSNQAFIYGNGLTITLGSQKARSGNALQEGPHNHISLCQSGAQGP